jgi:hypothetical protein
MKSVGEGGGVGEEEETSLTPARPHPRRCREETPVAKQGNPDDSLSSSPPRKRGRPTTSTVGESSLGLSPPQAQLHLLLVLRPLRFIPPAPGHRTPTLPFQKGSASVRPLKTLSNELSFAHAAHGLTGKVGEAARYDGWLLRFAVGVNLVAQREAEARRRPPAHRRTATCAPKLTVDLIAARLSISRQQVNAYLAVGRVCVGVPLLPILAILGVLELPQWTDVRTLFTKKGIDRLRREASPGWRSAWAACRGEVLRHQAKEWREDGCGDSEESSSEGPGWSPARLASSSAAVPPELLRTLTAHLATPGQAEGDRHSLTSALDDLLRETVKRRFVLV